jgi:hypothetical protein
MKGVKHRNYECFKFIDTILNIHRVTHMGLKRLHKKFLMKKKSNQPQQFADIESIVEGSCNGWNTSHQTRGLQNSTNWEGPDSATLRQ